MSRTHLRNSIDFIDVTVMTIAVVFMLVALVLPAAREAGLFPRSGALMVLAGLVIEFRWMHQTLALIEWKIADLGEELDETVSLAASSDRLAVTMERASFVKKRIELTRIESKTALAELFLDGYGYIPLILVVIGTLIWGFGDLIL